MTELQQILSRLDTLTPDEQQVVTDYIIKQQAERKALRKKELWGNVVAAINKYEKEIECISIDCHQCGEESTIDSITTGEPGYISIS